MGRWPILVAMSLAFPGLGCGDRLVAGLANAPSLNRTAPDESVHDVVANGSDSCGRELGRSPLRGHVPPCQAATPAIAPAPLVLPVAGASEEEDVVTPWLRHFYAPSPCVRASVSATSTLAVLSTESST